MLFNGMRTVCELLMGHHHHIIIIGGWMAGYHCGRNMKWGNELIVVGQNSNIWAYFRSFTIFSFHRGDGGHKMGRFWDRRAKAAVE